MGRFTLGEWIDARRRRKLLTQLTPTTGHLSTNGQQSYLGIGLYSIPEAARLLKTPGQTVRSWARGYTYLLDSKPKHIGPILTYDYPELAEEYILTFVDLVELYVVRMLRNREVPMQTIKEAARRLREKTGAKHPFAVRGIDTYARRVFHTNESGIEELGAYQYVIESVVKPFFKTLDYEDIKAGNVLRMWPIGHGRIVLDPKRSFGKPIVHKSAVPTFPLYRMRLAGETPERIARWYEIPVQSVKDAIEYEEYLAA